MLSFQFLGDVNASYYGGYFHGRLTANGERFNKEAMTCASYDLPFNTMLLVTHGDKSVMVRVNDRGGFKKYGRYLDLSEGAMRKLGGIKAGVIKVSVFKLNE